MRARLFQIGSWALSLVVLILVVWAFIEAVRAEPAVVGSVATAVIGVYGVIWQQRRAERSRLREAHRDRMTPVYDDLLRLVLESMDKNKRNRAKTENFMRDLKGRQLLLGGTSQMIRAFNAWEAGVSAAQKAGKDDAAVFAWEDLLRAIREDLGHDDSDLGRGELLRVFIDSEELDKWLAGQARPVVTPD
jgi:hypothetical protein